LAQDQRAAAPRPREPPDRDALRHAGARYRSCSTTDGTARALRLRGSARRTRRSTSWATCSRSRMRAATGP